MKNCAVKNCKSCNVRKDFDKNIIFFTFPKDPVISDLWMKACGKGVFKKKHATICSLHFTCEQWRLQDKLLNIPMKNRRLDPKAVPTIMLPKKNSSASYINRTIRAEKRFSKKILTEALEEYEIRKQLEGQQVEVIEVQREMVDENNKTVEIQTVLDEDEIEVLDNDLDSDFFLSDDSKQNENRNEPSNRMESPPYRVLKTKKFVKRYDQRIRKQWFYDARLKDWLEACVQHPKLLSCKFCNVNLTPKIYVLLKHAESKTHRFNITEDQNRSNAITTYSTKKKSPKKIQTPSVQINASPVKVKDNSNLMFLKFETNICRVCLKAEGTVSLFGPDNSVDNFRFITFLEASENDGLPQSLCIKCSARLKIAYNFKTQAISSENQLKNYLKDINQSFSQISTDKTSNEDDDLLRDIEQLNELMDPEDKIEVDKFEVTTSKNIKAENNEGNSFEVQVLFNDNTDTSLDNLVNSEDYNDPLKIKKRKNQFRKEDFDSDHECLICFKKFSTHSNLTRHKQIQHERENHTLFYCEICGKSFTVNGSLKQHMTIHTGERPFECNICHVKFRRKNTLVQHMKTHEPDRPWGCKLCKQSFELKENLMIHLNRDHNKLAIYYKCTQCDDKFQSKIALQDHAKEVHSLIDELMRFDCKLCEKSFTNSLCHSNHMQMHHNLEEDTSNTENSDMFTTDMSCEKMYEISITKDDERFECNDCPLKFGNQSDLLLHAELHKNELNEHITRVEIQEHNSYECRKCHQIFSNMENLFEHLKIHMEKFKCIYCNEMLLSKNILKSHIMKIHKNQFKELNVCNYCDLTFVTFDSFYDHMIKNHIDDEPIIIKDTLKFSNIKMESY